MRDAIDAAALVGAFSPSILSEARSVHASANWARHAPPPGAAAVAGIPPGVSVVKASTLEDFRSELYSTSLPVPSSLGVTEMDVLADDSAVEVADLEFPSSNELDSSVVPQLPCDDVEEDCAHAVASSSWVCLEDGHAGACMPYPRVLRCPDGLLCGDKQDGDDYECDSCNRDLAGAGVAWICSDGVHSYCHTCALQLATHSVCGMRGRMRLH